jgi:hypothetical protein
VRARADFDFDRASACEQAVRFGELLPLGGEQLAEPLHVAVELGHARGNLRELRVRAQGLCIDVCELRQRYQLVEHLCFASVRTTGNTLGAARAPPV